MDGLSCDEDLRRRMLRNLQNFNRTEIDPGRLKKAAVALAVVDYRNLGGLSGLREAEEQTSALILTRRARGLNRHAGQWALPGGRIDTGESAEQAALRELQEEVGLQCEPQSVLGRLDDFITRSGYHIVPIVVWAGPVAQLSPNRGEVASVHRISSRELLREDSPFFEPVLIPEKGAGEILYMAVGNSYIATPTAAILYQFREVAINGRSVRVAHYEQPFFAWS